MIYAALSGAIATLAFVAALLFGRAFRRTADRLFLFFAVAFALLGLERMILLATDRPELDNPLAFVPRIIAFALIIYGIVDRNRRR